MPMSLEPDQKYPLVLDSDKDKPKETRPTFWAKSQSMRKSRKLSELVDEWTGKATNTDELFSGAVEFLSTELLGWDHMIDPKTKKPIEFAKDAIEDLLTHPEARELIQKLLANDFLTEEEKKTSES